VRKWKEEEDKLEAKESKKPKRPPKPGKKKKKNLCKTIIHVQVFYFGNLFSDTVVYCYPHISFKWNSQIVY
jgi:hypothetical protein